MPEPQILLSPREISYESPGAKVRFGLIALLYLVTEELLAEAHEIPDRPWVAAMFFVGFLLLLALEEVM